MDTDSLQNEINQINTLVNRMHLVLRELSEHHDARCTCHWHAQARAIVHELEHTNKLTDWREYTPSSHQAWRRVGNFIEIRQK